MKKKKHDEPYKTGDKVRVKNSYYTFSREYPKGYITGIKKRKKTKKAYLRSALICLGLVAIALLSFFAVDLGLKISNSPMREGDFSADYVFDGNEAIKEKGLMAFYVPYGRLADEEYIRAVAKKVVRNDMNSVVIEFKTEEGKLCYSSLSEYAIAAKVSLFDNDTVRKALSIFGEYSIAVAAKICCLRDPAVASAVPSLAIKYMGTDVNWLDGSDETGGKPWLNPYSPQVAEYIGGVVSDLRALGINCFILSDVQFPDSENTQGATYPGETGERNAALKSFVDSIRARGDESTLFFLWQSVNEALDGDKIYYGKLSDANVDGIIYDMAERPDGYIIDKKTKYASILSLHSMVKGLSGNKMTTAVIEDEDFTYSYRRALTKSGYQSYIIRSATGEF